jgi:CheY-like chemotaxis protein
MSIGKLVTCGLEQWEGILKSVAQELDMDLVNISAFAEVKEQLEKDPPLGFLVNSQAEQGRVLSMGVRMATQLADLPIIAAIPEPWSSDVAEAFALGVDDYISQNGLGQVKKKLLALRKEGAPTGTYLSGKVVLADPDRERRVLMARHIKKMGLQVDFAVDGQTIPSDTSVKLVVANAHLNPGGAITCLRPYRQGPGAKIPWVISGTKAEIEQARSEWPDATALSYVDVEADLAQIAFTANKLLIGSARSMRRSPRLTYETTIFFNAIDGAVPEWGFTYNVNRGGIYVRTLTPPGLGQDLVLEFVPPFGRGHVVVDARVVWRQEYSGTKGYPPGFGIQYAEDLPIADNAALEAGYNKLLEVNGNPEA